jgi:hypothetical protein
VESISNLFLLSLAFFGYLGLILTDFSSFAFEGGALMSIYPEIANLIEITITSVD